MIAGVVKCWCGSKLVRTRVSLDGTEILCTCKICKKRWREDNLAYVNKVEKEADKADVECIGEGY